MKRLIFMLLIPAIAVISSFTGSDIRTITGKITAPDGSPVPFVNITTRGTKTATVSDLNGSYSIRVTKNDQALVFSAVGFVKTEVKIDKQSSVNVTLQRTNTDLQEVVVTAFGIQRQRKDIGYATATIKSSELTQSSPVNVSNALQGKVAGINIGTNSTGLYFKAFDGDTDDHNTEGYSNITENSFHKVTDDPLSTFSIDVDAASYSNMRRFLTSGQMPPAGAVRIEEMINYFSYQYPAPAKDKPFSINTEMADCPWNKSHKLVMIGLQGKQIPVEKLPASNLVFLIDVSGSMSDENKLPLVKSSLKMLTDQLREEDKISIVVYAGNAGLVLPATSGHEKNKIKAAIDQLESGGSTAGGEGIKLAYKTATENLMKNGNNRVILCTDGDFNVGASSDDEMVRLIENERKSGVYLTVLGYGMGNYQDSKMQQLADKGNGNHAYIDGLAEAKKVLVNEFGGTLFTIAKDVKLQIEFNPAKVAGYRLIGYENRVLAKEDFNDDKKDAGELGSGHTVTALYEIIPAGVKSGFLKSVDPLKYKNTNDENAVSSGEILTVKFRYKNPGTEKSDLISQVVNDKTIAFGKASSNFRFASAVAGFGMLLRNSEFKGSTNYDDIYKLASGALGTDTEGYRKEFLELVLEANKLSSKEAVVK